MKLHNLLSERFEEGNPYHGRFFMKIYWNAVEHNIRRTKLDIELFDWLYEK